MGSYRQQARAKARREQVAALYVRGQYQTEIARQLHVTQQQISMDLKAIRQQWLASTLRDFDAAKALELEKIDAVEREAWLAWGRSQELREVTMTEQSEGGEIRLADGTLHPRAPSRKASVRREGHAGDARFLERIQKCIDQRCVLLGLIASADTVTQAAVGLASLLEVARASRGSQPPDALMAEA